MKWVVGDGRHPCPTWFLVLGEEPADFERTVALVQRRRDINKYPSGREYYWIYLLFAPESGNNMVGWLTLAEAQQQAESLIPALWQLAYVKEKP